MALRILAFGPFEIERNGEVRVLRKNGVPLKIQGQPLDILERLTGQPGQVVSRRDLPQPSPATSKPQPVRRWCLAAARYRRCRQLYLEPPLPLRKLSLLSPDGTGAAYVAADPTQSSFSPRGFNQVRRYGVR